MNPTKIKDFQLLGDNFTILGSELRIAILHFLDKYTYPIEFGNIEKHLKTLFSESFKLSYHLKKLEEQNYLKKTGEGYVLTPFGHKTLLMIIQFKHLLTGESKILVRTSRYSLEPFNEKIIEEKLIEEADMPLKTAKLIAKEAKERLADAKITYLTAPLIREYINAILIEHQMEDYRHKLTRLGLPPFDVFQLLTKQEMTDPKNLRNILGKNVLEQFVLLNILKQRYADFFLSGKLVLSNLQHFGLSPLELIIPGNDLIEILERFYKVKPSSNCNPINNHTTIFNCDFLHFLRVFQQLLQEIQTFFPEGLVLLRFDQFIDRFLEHYSNTELNQFLTLGFETRNNWSVILGLSFQGNFINIDPILEFYVSTLNHHIKFWRSLPVLQLHLTNDELNELKGKDPSKYSTRLQQVCKLVLHHQVNIDQFQLWGHPHCEYIHSNLQVPLIFLDQEAVKPSILVEKISINCAKIFHECDKNNQTFYSQLEEIIFNVFDYFEAKIRLLRKNLNHFRNWTNLNAILFQNITVDKDTTSKTPIPNECPIYCGISLHGLDELIYQKSHLYLKDQKKNREIIIQILKFVSKLINKQNKSLTEPVIYTLGESHLQKELIAPSNPFLSSISPQSDIPSLSNSYKGYHYSLQFSEKTISRDHLLKIYQQFGNSKIPGLTAYVDTSHSKNNDINHLDYMLISNLLETGMTRISVSKTPAFWKTTQFANLSVEQRYIRYLSRYIPYKTAKQSYNLPDLNEEI